MSSPRKDQMVEDSGSFASVSAGQTLPVLAALLRDQEQLVRS